MDRALVAISMLLAAAAVAAADPPAAARATPEPPATDHAPQPAPPVDAAAASDSAQAPAVAAEVPSVEIKKLTDDTVCRRERPTGSLISVTRCYSRSAAALKDDPLMRRDLEEMRMRQNEQQAREAAAAMNRRRGGL